MANYTTITMDRNYKARAIFEPVPTPAPTPPPVTPATPPPTTPSPTPPPKTPTPPPVTPPPVYTPPPVTPPPAVPISITPTPSLTGTPAPSVTPSITRTPEPSVTPSITSTPGSSVTPSVSRTPDPSNTPVPSVTPSVTKTPAASSTPAASRTPDASVTPSRTPQASNTPQPSVTPTVSQIYWRSCLDGNLRAGVPPTGWVSRVYPQGGICWEPDGEVGFEPSLSDALVYEWRRGSVALPEARTIKATNPSYAATFAVDMASDPDITITPKSFTIGPRSSKSITVKVTQELLNRLADGMTNLALRVEVREL